MIAAPVSCGGFAIAALEIDRDVDPDVDVEDDPEPGDEEAVDEDDPDEGADDDAVRAGGVFGGAAVDDCAVTGAGWLETVAVEAADALELSVEVAEAAVEGVEAGACCCCGFAADGGLAVTCGLLAGCDAAAPALESSRSEKD